MFNFVPMTQQDICHGHISLSSWNTAVNLVPVDVVRTDSFCCNYRKNIHQLQAANAAVAQHMRSVETQSTTAGAHVNPIASSTATALSPAADASVPSLDASTGSPGTGSLFMSSGLGEQDPQLTCKCLNITPLLCYSVANAHARASGQGLVSLYLPPLGLP